MSIFPFIDAAKVEAVEVNDIPKEYAWDFDNNELILQNGNPVVIEGLEAIRVWIYKTLKTQRHRYLAYSHNYGHEIENLIGQRISRRIVDSEAKRYVEEALFVNKYIKKIIEFSITFTDDEFSMSFIVITDFGEVTINV